MSGKKFIAAKVNINENIFTGKLDDLVSRIPTAIESRKHFKGRTWRWQFLDVKRTEHGLVYGNLSKARDERRTVATESFTTGYAEIKDATYNSFFVYDPKNEILMFHENGRIDRDTFIHYWARLVYQGDPSIGDIIIIPFPVEEDLKLKVKGMEVLTRIEFEIIPPNMIKRKTLGSMRHLVQDANSTKTKYIAENKKEGLNKDGPLIDSGLEMVKNAYGYVKATGYDTFTTKGRGGKVKVTKTPRIFRSRDSVFHDTVQASEPLEIVEELKNLWGRAKNVVRGGGDDETNGKSL
ncbi:hypothetical protein [Alicyclobacillus fastidiosus]|uniref:DUF4747 domain-containing protein n=1 Tax=Alicyclobacillus fastidiosus TaxID=392011 RepID=A0ABV5AF16_9BACL|nr:hypothetical protein [Alicyclobacillus fastidiosus]WEH08522.1 hypothetical protein PYS47_17775 [Alicyclobacillus fastidiosus]